MYAPKKITLFRILEIKSLLLSLFLSLLLSLFCHFSVTFLFIIFCITFKVFPCICKKKDGSHFGVLTLWAHGFCFVVVVVVVVCSFVCSVGFVFLGFFFLFFFCSSAVMVVYVSRTELSNIKQCRSGNITRLKHWNHSSFSWQSGDLESWLRFRLKTLVGVYVWAINRSIG